MQIFDHLDPLKLDRRDAQLWMLAIAMIIIFATGIALLVYPAAFSKTVDISGAEMRRIFFSFCLLSLLIVGYLMERRIAIDQLRRRLQEEETRNTQLLQQASLELLGVMPKFDTFQDRLSMEFRRAAIARQPLSLVVVSLTPLNLAEGAEMAAAYGDAAKSIISRMRRADSIYLLRDGVFGVVLPNALAENAINVAERLNQGLAAVAGTANRFSFTLSVINYPKDASTAKEIESLAVRACPPRPIAARAA